MQAGPTVIGSVGPTESSGSSGSAGSAGSSQSSRSTRSQLTKLLSAISIPELVSTIIEYVAPLESALNNIVQGHFIDSTKKFNEIENHIGARWKTIDDKTHVANVLRRFETENPMYWIGLDQRITEYNTAEKRLENIMSFAPSVMYSNSNPSKLQLWNDSDVDHNSTCSHLKIECNWTNKSDRAVETNRDDNSKSLSGPDGPDGADGPDGPDGTKSENKSSKDDQEDGDVFTFDSDEDQITIDDKKQSSDQLQSRNFVNDAKVDDNDDDDVEVDDEDVDDQGVFDYGLYNVHDKSMSVTNAMYLLTHTANLVLLQTQRTFEICRGHYGNLIVEPQDLKEDKHNSPTSVPLQNDILNLSPSSIADCVPLNLQIGHLAPEYGARRLRRKLYRLVAFQKLMNELEPVLIEAEKMNEIYVKYSRTNGTNGSCADIRHLIDIRIFSKSNHKCLLRMYLTQVADMCAGC